MAGTLPHGERRERERRTFAGIPLWHATEGMRISWGGINGGVLLAVGLLILLAALGVAIGISAVNPGQTEASNVGTGAAVWSAISLLAALFLGGYASTKLGATSDSTTGFLEGALVWVVSMLLMLYLAGSGIGMLAGGAFQLVGGAGETVSSTITGAGDFSSGDANRVGSQGADPATQVPFAERAAAMQPEASAAAWITFGALVLSLAAAIGGGMVGRRDPEPERVSAR